MGKLKNKISKMSDTYETSKQHSDFLYIAKKFNEAYQSYLSTFIKFKKPVLLNNISACLLEMKNYDLSLLFSFNLLKYYPSATYKEKSRAYERAAAALPKLSNESSSNHIDSNEAAEKFLDKFETKIPNLSFNDIKDQDKILAIIEENKLKLKEDFEILKSTKKKFLIHL